MNTVFVTVSLPLDLLARLKSNFHVVEVPEGAAENLATYGDPVGWLIRGGTEINASVLAQLPSLKVISKHGVGYDLINVDDASAAGVVVANTPGVLDTAVAELALGLIITLGRGISRLDTYVRDGSWMTRPAPLADDVHGKTLGIVGMGRIGTRLAELVQPLGMRVLYHNRRVRPEIEASGIAAYAEWDALLRRADFVSLHVPLTERTRGFFARDALNLMKPSAYLINLARGSIVDETALISAITTGRIAGAALDVFVEEPLPLTSPLLEFENVILLPHIGSATAETRRAMVELAVANLELGARGRTPHTPVNTDDPRLAHWS